jgi:hypothetical protein
MCERALGAIRLSACIDAFTGLSHMRRRMISHDPPQALAREHGTPLGVIDHDVLRRHYAVFKEHLPTLQFFHAVSANLDPAIISPFYAIGSKQGVPVTTSRFT